MIQILEGTPLHVLSTKAVDVLNENDVQELVKSFRRMMKGRGQISWYCEPKNFWVGNLKLPGSNLIFLLKKLKK